MQKLTYKQIYIFFIYSYTSKCNAAFRRLTWQHH